MTRASLPWNVLTNVLTPCEDLHMSSNQPLEVRFTAKRALYWNGANRRWQGIARDKATAMIALGEAVELKAGEWV